MIEQMNRKLIIQAIISYIFIVFVLFSGFWIIAELICISISNCSFNIWCIPAFGLSCYGSMISYVKAGYTLNTIQELKSKKR